MNITKKYYFTYTEEEAKDVMLTPEGGCFLATDSTIVQADTATEIKAKILDLGFDVPVKFENYITDFYSKWQRKNHDIRFHVRLIDTYGEGILSAKTQEMQVKKNPSFRVRSNHRKDTDSGEWIDVYLNKINPADMDLINSYLAGIAGSKLEKLSEL